MAEMTEGGVLHRLAIARTAVKWHVRRHSWLALGRELFNVIVLRHWSESCEECGRRYCCTVWRAPDWLWIEVIGDSGGLLCPRCFSDKAKAKGLQLTWEPRGRD